MYKGESNPAYKKYIIFMLTIFKIKFLGTYVMTHLLLHIFRKGPSSKLGQQLQIGVIKFYVLIYMQTSIRIRESKNYN